MPVRGVIKKYTECLNKKNYYSKRRIAINPPRFEHAYPIVLATFWSRSGSPLSWVSLVAMLWLWHDVLNLFQMFTFHGYFLLWGRARNRTVPDLVNKVDDDTL